MADAKFWIRTITLDEKSQVDQVTAIASQETMDAITAVLGHAPGAVTVPHDYREITLPAADMQALWGALGSGCDMPGEHESPIYQHLAMIYYGLLGG